jgi:preprotein translocase subunit SecA
MDWDAAGDKLERALTDLWDRRTERVRAEVERELENELGRVEEIDRALLTRLLVRMSYGREAFFDRKTHQRRAKVVSRFTYVFYAGKLIDGLEAEDVIARVHTHLEGARRALGASIGRSEFARLSGTTLKDIPAPVLQDLRDDFGSQAYEESAEQGLASLRGEMRQQTEMALGTYALNQAYRGLILSVGDRLWVDYLTQMEGLRTSIGLEAYAQRDPLVQYKRRAFDMFESLLADVRSGIVSQIFRVRPAAQAQSASASRSKPARTTTVSPSPKDGGTKRRKKRRRRRR